MSIPIEAFVPRRRAHVLRAPGQLVEFGAVALDHRLDRGIEQFQRQYQQAAAQQQRTLDPVRAQPDRQGREHHQQVHLEPERGLVQPGRAQALERPHGRLQDPGRSARKMPGLVRHPRLSGPAGGRWRPPGGRASGRFGTARTCVGTLDSVDRGCNTRRAAEAARKAA
jgi:hypothetical protein